MHVPSSLRVFKAQGNKERPVFSTFVKGNKELQTDLDELDFAYNDKLEDFVVNKCAHIIHTAILNELFTRNDDIVSFLLYNYSIVLLKLTFLTSFQV
jgi:hypothetical protein